VDAERQLLATLLVNPELDPLVAQLTPADFQIERNRWLFQAATALARRSEPVTVETVTDELQRMGRLPDLEHGIYVMGIAAELRSSYQGN
jgi:replicative DNA helicase